MSMRIRIAKWLAPEWGEQHGEHVAEKRDLRFDLHRCRLDWLRAYSALNAIVSRGQKSSPNSTVRAMVRIAQDALETKEQANG